MTTQERIAAVIREALPDALGVFHMKLCFTDSEYDAIACELAARVAAIPGLTIAEPGECFNPGHYELPERGDV